ncbi:MAG: hypothetical protein EAZ85_11180 [Bacteroidetes bacterium]|nr:MAG: hypothetical protein EAZ85_11180 [Bacteroidota bacterium]TAG87861.1 MAG: hypothetical protein EAZ20_09730 [Bacteroidota bacterium]
MKNIFFIIFVVGLSLWLNACCTMKGCIPSDIVYSITFYNFSQAETDTVQIISYAKNSNFNTKVDSLVVGSRAVDDYYAAYTNRGLTADLDYKIKLLSTGQVFTLTDFEIRKEKCNYCFPYSPPSNFYNQLSAYRINGQKQTDSQIKIYK